MGCGLVFKAKLLLVNSGTWITVFQERVNVDLTRPISHSLCHRTTIIRLRQQPVGLKAWCYLQHKTKLPKSCNPSPRVLYLGLLGICELSHYRSAHVPLTLSS